MYSDDEENCCCFNSKNRVLPLDTLIGDKKYLQVRANHLLSIYHINASPRNEKLEKEMNKFIMKHVYAAKFRPSSLPQYVDSVHTSGDVKGGSIKINGTDAAEDFVSPSQLTSTIQSRQPSKTFDPTARNHLRNDLTANDALADKLKTKLQDLSLNSARTNHQPSTEGNKPVVFLLHGVGGSAHVWRAQIEHLTTLGYEIIAPDLLGHGNSGCPRDPEAYTFTEILIDVLLIFDFFRKQENYVIGHSYGACFAAVLARRRSEYVKKLVMISGGGPTPLAPQFGLFTLPACMLSCLGPVLTRAFKRRAFSHSRRGTVVAEDAYAFKVRPWVLKYVMNGQSWPEGNRDFHERISCPTLLLHGAEDELVSIDEELDMAETICGSQLHIIDCVSHMVMMEQSGQVNNILRAFLTSKRFSSNVNQANPIIDDVSNCSSVDLEAYRVSGASDAQNQHTLTRENGKATLAREPTVVYMSPSHDSAALQHRPQTRTSSKSARSIPARLF